MTLRVSFEADAIRTSIVLQRWFKNQTFYPKIEYFFETTYLFDLQFEKLTIYAVNQKFDFILTK